MTAVTALCDECGHLFNTGFALGPMSVMDHCQISCPNCKHTAEINVMTDPAGNLISLTENAFDWLSSPDVSTEDLAKLNSLLTSSNKEKTDESELIKKIKTDVPNLNKISRLITPTNPGEFWTMVATLSAIVTLILVMRAQPQKNEIKNIEQNFIIQLYNEFGKCDDPEAEVYKSAVKKGVFKINDPCPCGSGRSFKHCHGA